MKINKNTTFKIFSEKIECIKKLYYKIIKENLVNVCGFSNIDGNSFTIDERIEIHGAIDGDISIYLMPKDLGNNDFVQHFCPDIKELMPLFKEIIKIKGNISYSDIAKIRHELYFHIFT